MDCFVAEPVIGLAEGETRWLLAMTTKHSFAISPRIRASFAESIPPSVIRGRRECRAPDAPAAARVV
jgi:hypothetical protein